MNRLTPLLALALVVGGCAGPTSTPGAPSAEGVIAAFIAQTQATDRSMHLEYTADVEAGRFAGQISGRFDLQGADSAGVILFQAPDPLDPLAVVETGSEIIVVGGQGFTRNHPTVQGHDTWAPAEETAPIDPLTGLAAADMEYHGFETGGASLPAGHHLKAADATVIFRRTVGYMLSAEAFSQLEVTDSDFSVWVDDNGVPSAATLRVDGVVNSDQGGPLHVDYQWSLSRWGDSFDIKPPH